MHHLSDCPCCHDLSVALAALEQSSAMLCVFVFDHSADVFERHYAEFRMCQIRVRAALELYREHIPQAV